VLPASYGAHPASYTMAMGGGGAFLGGKVQLGRDVDCSAPCRAEVKRERGYTSSPTKCLSWHVVGQLYFTYTVEYAE
jgi:hypothetical protein